MLKFYKYITGNLEWLFIALLRRRIRRGKEAPERLSERMGEYSIERPQGNLIWLHAASVGEAQSALILIQRLLQQSDDQNILVTTGTLTSAKLMKDKLPDGAFHQFAPLDHPQWVSTFLDHWNPDLVLWLESELWPNMLLQIHERQIPSILLNARLSDKSFKRWQHFKHSAQEILNAFDLILTQTPLDQSRYRGLGAKAAEHMGNIKFSAAPLPYNDSALQNLRNAIGERPVWLYASTHKGEEKLAAAIHTKLKHSMPDLLTIIVPRHPERAADIEKELRTTSKLKIKRRGTKLALPGSDTDIYLADTMGELGLFYELSEMACIGRSLSDDGGGGHNPLEAAQLNCVVLHGPNVQFQKDIYAQMHKAKAAIEVSNAEELAQQIEELFQDNKKRGDYQKRGREFVAEQSKIIDHVLESISPHMQRIAEHSKVAS